ncbi:peptidylprolyl isomerase [Hymenobacter busanensis]|uniref:Peptidyl-prolyl cis-trans isomerase n=1 Tax=Hymenobacter busanensis TaxID=2607656 RepID=A0A7L4ZVL3_9BACT|nr:peptidylprolyl isomerase [Hymenobacter busanensis]KAA9332402.1 peptidylprolyl isomerase [Hymenobacter busanensis]QHJ07261.1 peptidylprolyl isomerase [Hymenobacter busanensis]
MRRFSLVLLTAGCAALAACNQQPPAQDKPAAPAAPTTPDKSGRPGPDLTTISDSNAVAVLTQYGQEHPETEVLFKTTFGNIRVRLYKDTPLHRANFLLLANKGYFDQTVFYRVVKDFVVQGGNSDHRTIRLHKYHLPPEIRPAYFHRRGALGMARYDNEKNPQRLSSSHDFYFVQGTKLPPAQAQASAGRSLTPAQVQAYATQGGVPSLDGQYTVFGEVTEGLDVVEKIANTPVDAYKWPLKDVEMKLEVLK